MKIIQVSTYKTELQPPETRVEVGLGWTSEGCLGYHQGHSRKQKSQKESKDL